MSVRPVAAGAPANRAKRTRPFPPPPPDPFPELAAFCVTLPHVNHYFEWVELRGFFASAGWGAYQTIFWFWSAVFVCCIAICLYVCYCFRRDSFPYLWPVKVLRNILGLFFSIFYVTSLNFFLISLDCQTNGDRQTLTLFSDQVCWQGKLLAMQAVAIILGVCFFSVSLLLAVAGACAAPVQRPGLTLALALTHLSPATEFETDASQLDPLGAADSSSEIRMFFMRNLITLASTFMGGFQTFMILLLCSCTFEMARQMVIVQPHYFQVTNQLVRTPLPPAGRGGRL